LSRNLLNPGSRAAYVSYCTGVHCAYQRQQ